MPVRTQQGWADRLKELKPTMDYDAAATEFALAVGELTDEMNVVGGDPGFFTFDQPVFKANIMLQPTMSLNSWAIIIANAWRLAMTAGVVTPSTATDAAWTGSGLKDTVTSGTGGAVFQNLSAAKAVLQAGLIASVATDNSTVAFGKAFRDATVMLTALVIGLGPTPTLTPIPLIKAVE